MNHCSHQKLWIANGIAAIALSGLLSLAIVVLRLWKPSMLSANIFDVSLAAHVNLAIMVWQTTIIHSWSSPTILTGTAFTTSLLATICFAISTIIPDSEVWKSNYIPVIDNLLFFIGLGFLASSAILVALSETIFRSDKDAPYWTTSAIILLALVNMVIAYHSNDVVSKIALFEGLFWGAGHVLQFAFSNAMLIACTKISGVTFNKWCYILGLLLVLPTPLFYLMDDHFASARLFTLHMQFAGGLPFLIAISDLVIKGELRKLFSYPAIQCSFILFLFGGALGIAIHEHNTTIPAHYHGSIVGISMALMGYVYHVLGTSKRLTKIQTYLYALGQIMHISGLAMMGGYGALRKTAGADLPASAWIAKSIFMSGGAITVLSGTMFVVLAIAGLFKSIEFRKPTTA